MKILHVVGARPNFMKIAPVMREMSLHPDRFEQVLVHTGQHYDPKMSGVFFEELELPHPDINLSVGSGSHAWQTAQIMMSFEPVVTEHTPDWVFVPGDVNSTVACALVCAKLGIRVAHLEAGLRSFDRTMPEEINRVITDQISDLLLTPSRDGDENLLKEGIPASRIRLVGNVMIDTLVRLLPKAEQRWDSTLAAQYPYERFLVVTLHRPSNVDDPARLGELLRALADAAQQIPVVFPVHPRTRERLAGAGELPGSIHYVDPLSYLDFLALQMHASCLVTDSGGIQEETSYLGVPCLTLRANTERPVTITHGTNRLITGGIEQLHAELRSVLSSGSERRRPEIELWDGKASERIVRVLNEFR